MLINRYESIVELMMNMLLGDGMQLEEVDY